MESGMEVRFTIRNRGRIMDGRYKVILYNKNIYKELELTPDQSELRVGTGVEADVRLHREYFFGKVEIVFSRNCSAWKVT